jgi:TolA-binding protein
MLNAGRLFLIAVLWFAAVFTGSADPAENRAFTAAANAFQAGIWERSEKEFGEFAQKYSASPRLQEALLFQAESRLQLTNYDGAIQLLSAGLTNAGTWTDQYLFWLGESHARKGDPRQASDFFSRVLAEHPGSARRLQAGLGQIAALSRLADWQKLIDILSAPAGWLEEARKSNPTNPAVVRGSLLLGEAYLNLNQAAAAEAALAPLQRLSLDSRSDWQRQFLTSRILLATGRLPEALSSASNSLALAAATGQKTVLSETVAFNASLLERLARYEEAILAYTNNLAEGIPIDRQQQAAGKVAELSVALQRPSLGADILTAFLPLLPSNSVAPLALYNVGELRLRQAMAAGAAGVAASTNLVPQAAAAFLDFTNRFPSHPMIGRANLNLGWCFWLENRWPESEAAFRRAAELLPASLEQAVAIFKLGDAQFQQTNYPAALASYTAISSQLSERPEVRTNLLEQALYQSVRAGLAAGDVPSATNQLARLLREFPAGFHTDSAILMAGQQISRAGNPAAARAIFTSFVEQLPSADLLPLVRVAIARTYEQEGQWTNASRIYSQWLQAYTNHPARPGAEYYLAWAEFQSGHESNALTGFTNLIARFPQSEFAPLGQLWVGDYFFRTGEPVEAEKNYKALFQNTNLPPSDFTYQARLMAGRAALARQGWLDGINHFTNLTSDLAAPVDLRVQAMFAYGDTLMRMDAPETNRLGNLETAISVFSKICDSYPSNRLAALAWGQKANCFLQWGLHAQDYAPASNAFYQVLLSPQADGAARSIAKIGLGVVLEKLAESASGPEQAALLAAARDHYLDVLYGKTLREGDTADPFWTRKAGYDAARITESLAQWSQAVSIYQQMQKAFPALAPRLERNIRRAQDQLKAKAEKG